MNVLMYPFGPDDDFPDEFCAIRQGSGEHWFYTPVGESASWMLFRAEVENAKLRELVRDMGELLDVLSECDMVCEHYHDGCIGDCYYVNARRELGIEVG